MSSDRFNPNVDLRVKTEATPIRRIEVITGVERRRKWTDEEKRAIIAESSEDGMIAAERPTTAPAEAPVSDAPVIEIVLGVVTVRTRGSVDARGLAAVLRAVKAVA
jgi:hypothetical protein